MANYRRMNAITVSIELDSLAYGLLLKRNVRIKMIFQIKVHIGDFMQRYNQYYNYGYIKVIQPHNREANSTFPSERFSLYIRS